jgi:hypothetical protein
MAAVDIPKTANRTAFTFMRIPLLIDQTTLASTKPLHRPFPLDELQEVSTLNRLGLSVERTTPDHRIAYDPAALWGMATDE